MAKLRPLAPTLTLAALCALAATAHAKAEIPPAPRQWATDQAGLVSPGTLALLNRQLAAFEAQTGHQVVVYIDSSTEGTPIEEWAARAFEAWGVGRKGKDDGAALFVFAEDRKARIEVGYGLEGEVPDAIASRIIREQLVPRLQAGDADGAVRGSVGALLSAISGQPPPEGLQDQPRARERVPLTGGQKLVYGILAVLFLLLLITNPGLALAILFQLMSGGRGGGRGGGGGFSGGGGRSGGGGATGSW